MQWYAFFIMIRHFYLKGEGVQVFSHFIHYIEIEKLKDSEKKSVSRVVKGGGEFPGWRFTLFRLSV